MFWKTLDWYHHGSLFCTFSKSFHRLPSVTTVPNASWALLSFIKHILWYFCDDIFFIIICLRSCLKTWRLKLLRKWYSQSTMQLFLYTNNRYLQPTMSHSCARLFLSSGSIKQTCHVILLCWHVSCVYDSIFWKNERSSFWRNEGSLFWKIVESCHDEIVFCTLSRDFTGYHVPILYTLLHVYQSRSTGIPGDTSVIKVFYVHITPSVFQKWEARCLEKKSHMIL